MFLFLLLSPKSLKLLRTAQLTGISRRNKHVTSSMFLSDKEFVGKLNQWLELVKHLGSGAILDSRKSLSHQLLEGVKDQLPYSCFFSFHPLSEAGSWARWTFWSTLCGNSYTVNLRGETPKLLKPGMCSFLPTQMPYSYSWSLFFVSFMFDI